MTDRFEEAVRQAAKELGGQGPGGVHHDLPTYHDSWQRGRRRRFVKRSALAAAGALVFIAASSVNLGRFPGTNSTEVDDVAVEVTAATPSFVPTPLATTEPVESPTLNAVAPVPTVPIPTSPSPQPTPDATSESSAPAAPAATVVPAPTPPAATDVPAPTAGPTPAPTSSATTDPTATPDPPVAADAAQSPDTTPEAAAQPTAEASATIDQPPTEPELAFTTAGPGQPADVIVLGAADRGIELECDIDQDGEADGTCDLLPDYACGSESKVEPGYAPFDSDNDGTIDTCRAVGITVCDTTGDGLGDTPCIVELTPAADSTSISPPNE